MSQYTSTILVTGGTLGLGFWAAYELACNFPNSKIVISARSDKENAVDRLDELVQKRNSSPSNRKERQIGFRPLDLSSTSKVRKFVEDFAAQGYPPVSSLVLNAGVQFHEGKEITLSSDGVEMTFAVNHLGHALLLYLLKPHMTTDARIVFVASGVHDPAQKTGLPDAKYETAELLAHPADKNGYEVNQGGFQRYSSSKLVNVLFIYALEERLKKAREAGRSNWTVCAMDPGLMPGTGLAREMGPVVMWLVTHILTRMLWLLKLAIRSQNVHLPQNSGKNLAFLASKKGPDAMQSSGQYFEGARAIDSSVDSHNKMKQEDLWRWTVDFLAKDGEEKERFENF
ncbi:hypothetical protein LTR64_000795 [Lithohypha guttulata]|uniref:uncharacterized protein n=1 Tax=Lithohypha guttulata TaxID=1690604 RepID=UPI002DDEF763|nr:hypothetical protein LTR51_005439 [Lithohypha guttulata]